MYFKFLPLRKHVHTESLLIQDEITNEVQSKLISLKLDGVTRLNRAFLGINMQYIVDDCIKLRTLGLVELTESHTGKYLKYLDFSTIIIYNNNTII